MFGEALNEVAKFTFPVISSKRLLNGTVQCGCASFIVLNPEGWILTAAHVLEDLMLFQKHKNEMTNYENMKKEIADHPTLLPRQKKKKIARLEKNGQWITHQSYWWGLDGLSIPEFKIDSLADLATGKLQLFDGAKITAYPVTCPPKTGPVRM